MKDASGEQKVKNHEGELMGEGDKDVHTTRATTSRPSELISNGTSSQTDCELSPLIFQVPRLPWSNRFCIMGNKRTVVLNMMALHLWWQWNWEKGRKTEKERKKEKLWGWLSGSKEQGFRYLLIRWRDYDPEAVLVSPGWLTGRSNA